MRSWCQGRHSVKAVIVSVTLAGPVAAVWGGWHSRGVERRASLSLNEWAVLGVLTDAPRHGYDVAAALRPEAPIGQVWSVSRRLVYRALDRLVALGLAEPRREEPGEAGPTRTVYGTTRRGRATLRQWLDTPVEHVRDVRSGLLLKLVLARVLDADTAALIARQRDALSEQLDVLTRPVPTRDPIAMWRHHSAVAAERFLTDLSSTPGDGRRR